jgi:hypothetical protein
MKTSKIDTVMYRRTWLMPLGTGVTGLLLGLLIAQTSIQPSAPQFESDQQLNGVTSDAQTTVSTNTICPTGAVASITDVRLSIRQEFVAFASSLKSTDGNVADGYRTKDASQTSSDSQLATPPSAAQFAAASRAHSIVDTAIAHQLWTERDAERFRIEFDSLTHEQGTEVLQKFAVAINRGQLVPQTDRIPF